MSDFVIGGVIKKPQPNPTNWQYEKHKSCMATPETMLPRVFSLKELFPPVYTQVWGSCTANAVCACDHYYYHHNTDWKPSCTFNYYLSRRKSGYKNSKKDEGSCVEFALDVCRKYGVCNSKVWANEEPFYKRPSKEAFENGLYGKEITTYYQVKNLSQIKKAIYNGYPVVIAVAWVFKDYDENFVMNTPTKKEIDKCTSGHAIVVVGYDDDKKLFEIRNSWSDKWANKGYAFISYDVMKKVIWFEDSYAVVK